MLFTEISFDFTSVKFIGTHQSSTYNGCFWRKWSWNESWFLYLFEYTGCFYLLQPGIQLGNVVKSMLAFNDIFGLVSQPFLI